MRRVTDGDATPQLAASTGVAAHKYRRCCSSCVRIKLKSWLSATPHSAKSLTVAISCRICCDDWNDESSFHSLGSSFGKSMNASNAVKIRSEADVTKSKTLLAAMASFAARSTYTLASSSPQMICRFFASSLRDVRMRIGKQFFEGSQVSRWSGNGR